MDLEMVLNELSLHPPATEAHEARERMFALVQTIIVATKSGVKKVLRTNSHFGSEELAPGYPVVKWLNDINVDRDSQRFIRLLLTKSPFLEDITENNILESFSLSEYFWKEKQATGLGVAFLLDALALSLSSDPCWSENYIQLRISQLDDDAEIIDAFENLPHASNVDHVYTHLPWIKKRLHTNMRLDVHEGLDIWSHKEEWFTHLYFCERVKEQLLLLHRGNIMLAPVLKRLQELEDYCCNWLDGPFDQNKIPSKVSPESMATLEMYSSEHTFRCHDGISRLFSWHLRLTPAAWRLFFYPLPEERKLIIGHIGPKLPTQLYGH